MRIAIGSDHAGFELKELLVVYLRNLNQQVLDLGTHNTDHVDYPDFAEAVGEAIRDGRADRGILICCSGVGASVAATKLPGIRAGLCHDTYSAHQGVEHDDMNILVLGACVVGSELARELVRAFVGATFTGEERHRRRLEKIHALEIRYRQQQTNPEEKKNALTIYPYSDVEAILKGESAGGDKAPLPGTGDKPCTERPDPG